MLLFFIILSLILYLVGGWITVLFISTEEGLDVPDSLRSYAPSDWFCLLTWFISWPAVWIYHHPKNPWL